MPKNLSDPNVVFHYTSAAALLKIVESGSIWATNLRYLNDITESTHCIAALRRRATNYLARNPSEFGDELQSALERVESETEPPYVASFSTVQDSLPLWRSYCPNGNGVSIGFKVAALKKSALTFKSPGNHPIQNSTLKRVEYLDLSDFDLQDRILGECLERLSSYQKERDAEPPDEQSSSYDDESVLMWEIGNRSCLVKHSGFETEQEIRLIAPRLFLSGASLKFRCPRTTIIPYLEVLMPKRKKVEVRPVRKMLGLKYDDYFIDSVTVGPTPNPDLTSKALELLSESKQIDDVTILTSDIPYRDL